MSLKFFKKINKLREERSTYFLNFRYEHNFGHGYKTLSNLLAGLMLLAFLVDQCLEALTVEFKGALEKCGSRVVLWETIRFLFHWVLIDDWDKLYKSILDPPIFRFN
jgi:hypothetical protein